MPDAVGGPVWWLNAMIGQMMSMSSKRSRGSLRWLSAVVAVILAAYAAGGSAQTGSGLASLTVPERNLPNGCRLKPYVPAATFVVPRGVVHGNPWVGTDRRLVIDLRRRIDGALPFPDAPPPTAAEISALEHRWVARVVEGYEAAYLSAEDVVVEVSAIRFDEARHATTTPEWVGLHAPEGLRERLVVGSAVVLVRANSKTDCFQAVSAYIRGRR